MDVWSIGLIFAYLLKDGESLLGANNLGYPWGAMFYTLGNPTEEEFRDGLKSGQIWRVTHARNGYENFKKHFPHYDRMPVKWLKILNEMLDYHPMRRVTITQLVNHKTFLDYFQENPYLSKLDDNMTRPSQIHQIQINLPNDIYTWTSHSIRKCIVLYFNTRREFVEETRIDLMVLVKNLAKQTQVPLQIWITIITLANTRPSYMVYKHNESL